MGSTVYTGARPIGDLLEVKDNEGVKLKDALAQTLAATPEAKPREFESPAAALHRSAHRAGSAARKRAQDDRRRHRHPGPALVQRRSLRRDRPRGHDAARIARKDAVRDASRSSTRCPNLLHDPKDVTRFTVGRMLVTPNSPNSVREPRAVLGRYPPSRSSELSPGLANAVEPLRARLHNTATSKSRRRCTTIRARFTPTWWIASSGQRRHSGFHTGACRRARSSRGT